MGAWIEIQDRQNALLTTTSLLSWERGLKYINKQKMVHYWYVAPLVGAWIEIVKVHRTMRVQYVAPLVGAWIEIYFITV